MAAFSLAMHALTCTHNNTHHRCSAGGLLSGRGPAGPGSDSSRVWWHRAHADQQQQRRTGHPRKAWATTTTRAPAGVVPMEVVVELGLVVVEARRTAESLSRRRGAGRREPYPLEGSVREVQTVRRSTKKAVTMGAAMVVTAAAANVQATSHLFPFTLPRSLAPSLPLLVPLSFEREHKSKQQQ